MLSIFDVPPAAPGVACSALRRQSRSSFSSALPRTSCSLFGFSAIFARRLRCQVAKSVCTPSAHALSLHAHILVLNESSSPSAASIGSLVAAGLVLLPGFAVTFARQARIALSITLPCCSISLLGR